MATTRDRIIEAALGLVAERGLGAVTMIDIARTAAVARATLYNHYPDVASILADAAEHHNDQAITGLRQSLAVVASPTETIEQLVRYIATISAHGHTLATHHGFPPDLRHRLSAFDDELDRQITSTNEHRINIAGTIVNRATKTKVSAQMAKNKRVATPPVARTRNWLGLVDSKLSASVSVVCERSFQTKDPVSLALAR